VLEPPLQIAFVRADGDRTALTNAICRGGSITSRPYSAFLKKNVYMKSNHTSSIYIYNTSTTTAAYIYMNPIASTSTHILYKSAHNKSK
jgi:hypothetical protein